MDQKFIDLLLAPDANLSLPAPELVQYYQDLQNRVYWINDEIGDNYLDLISKIVRWNREDRVLPPGEGRKPIKIFFNSPGGSLDIEEALVSVIQLSKTPVWGFALGMVASAASLVYLSTHIRYALPNAYFILHRGSCQNISGDYANVQNAMADYRRQIEQLEKFYLKYTKITPEEIQAKLDSDWYVRGEELIEKGLVDKWITSIDEML